MRSGIVRLTTVIIAFAVVGAGGLVWAEDSGSGVPAMDILPASANTVVGDGDNPAFVPNEFGIADSDISVIPWMSFLPRDSSDGYNDGAQGVHDRHNTGSSYLYASIGNGDVPNGAEITQIGYYVYDSNGSSDLDLGYCTWWADSGSGQNYNASCTYPVSSSGSSGAMGAFWWPSTTLTMQRRYDHDADMDTDVVGWSLITDQNGVVDGTLAIGFVRIIWKRQISTAPMSATFNDVSTGHWAFQSVEALAAAEITLGCGGGNFCPGQAVTRAEMAAFLARALGLHWPSGLGF
jgi:hypothetical protein